MKCHMLCVWTIALMFGMLQLLAQEPVIDAQTVEVKAGEAVIATPASAADWEADAARELQKHLALVLGQEPEIVSTEAEPAGYPFYVGVKPSHDETVMAPDEARWSISPTGTHFYGNGRYAALFAVYSFLADQVGIDWIEPGDAGIVYKSRQKLLLPAGDFNWTPELMFRKIRLGNARTRQRMFTLNGDMKGFSDFVPTLEEHNAFAAAVDQWQKRMRMGGSRPGGGHAFSNWWAKYGESNPEYFALNKNGRREPVPMAKPEQTDSFVKVCAGNPKVAERVVADWLPKRERIRYVNTGLNDGSQNFCECEKCRNLDVPRDGELTMTHLTDRYVYLTNGVAREIRKHRPDACATMYAYLTTLYPPRKMKVEPNVVVQLVPYVDPLDLDTVKEHLEGWKNAGATMLAFRPNYHCKYLTTTIPLGIEKQMFEVFQLAVQNGCISADYDSLTNNWPVTGFSDYVLAKAMADPSKSFEYWAERYYSAFGNAAQEVKEYFEYWRNELWDTRLQPNIRTICNTGGAGDFARGLLWSLGDYYRPADFRQAAAILKRAAAKELTAIEQERLGQLQLATEHARLMYEAIAAKPQEKAGFAEKLLAFRRQNKDRLRLQWVGVFANEVNNGDLTGLLIADQMKDYLKPWLQTNLFWKFKLDQNDSGLQQKWQQLNWEQMNDWLQFRTDRFLERQVEFDEPHNFPAETAEVIFTYDGIAWYATQQAIPQDWRGRQIFLRFGAVDESCWVYVNGQFAGEHIYKEKNDWKTPFEIPINNCIDWTAPQQTITVRVEDRGGMGGIWRRVWVVSKPLDR